MVGRGTIRGMTDRFTADPRLGHPLPAGNHDAAHPMRAKALAGHPRFLRAFDTVAAATTLKIEGRRAVVNHFPYDRDHTEPDRHVLVRAAAGPCRPGSRRPRRSISTGGVMMVPWVGLEPTRPKALHFECSASANSATRANKRR